MRQLLLAGTMIVTGLAAAPMFVTSGQAASFTIPTITPSESSFERTACSAMNDTPISGIVLVAGCNDGGGSGGGGGNPGPGPGPGPGGGGGGGSSGGGVGGTRAR